MRQVAVLGLAVMMAVVGVAADYEVRAICTASNEQSKPQIDGGWVVWRDKRNTTANYDVYGYNLSLGQEFVISADPAVAEDTPKVSGDFALWVNGATNQRDIRFFQLSTKQIVSFPNFPANDSVAQRNAVISGNRVVYENYENNKWVLYHYNITTQSKAVVANSDYSQINPVVSENFVVWMENPGSGYRLYWRNLNTSNPAAPVGDNGYEQNTPAISGNLVVWTEAIPNNQMDVCGRYLPNGQRFVIAQGAADQNFPAVSGSIVVWQEKKAGRTDYDICGIDLSDGTALTIASGTEDDQYPAISGRTVVWQRRWCLHADCPWDIVGTVIPSSTQVVITAPAAEAVLPAGIEIQVAWSLVSGDAPMAVDIQFSTNGGSGWVWQTLATGVSFASGTALCRLPEDADSQNCKIQLVNAVSKAPLLSPSAVFTVYQCDDRLTADITGDCVVNIDDIAALAAQWLRCGNPYNAACLW